MDEIICMHLVLVTTKVLFGFNRRCLFFQMQWVSAVTWDKFLLLLLKKVCDIEISKPNIIVNYFKDNVVGHAVEED